MEKHTAIGVFLTLLLCSVLVIGNPAESDQPPSGAPPNGTPPPGGFPRGPPPSGKPRGTPPSGAFNAPSSG